MVEIVTRRRDVVGESAVWDDRRGCLVRVDIVGRLVHRLDPATGAEESWDAPDFVTSIGLRDDGGAVVGLRRSVALWEFGGAFDTLAVPEPELPGNRLNEGVVGPDGAFWVGTMRDNLDDDGNPRDITASTGAIHRVRADGSAQRLTPQEIGLVNTLAWLPDGRLVTADTLANELHCYAHDPVGGTLSGRRRFAEPFDRGLPDGSCVDAAGYLWNCRVGGGACLVRHARDGTLDRVVELPCSWPTSCAFGGEDLATLYVTSARFTMSPAHLDAHPQEGAVFALRPGVRGLPAHRFRSRRP